MNAQDVLMYAHRTVERSLEGLPEDAWYNPGVCGVWSVKDIIAHLASFEHLLVEVLRSQSQRVPTLTLQRYISNPSFNDEEVSRRQSLSAQQVWEEYSGAHAHTLELIDQIPQDMQRRLGLLPWYGEKYDLEDFIVYSFYGHKREHTAQINVYKDYLKGLGPGSIASYTDVEG